jgi:predicted AAA+ superfamily ATPase
VDPSVWLQDYVSTYLERDVRNILNIHDLSAFQRFVQLCAGRVGQLLNVSSLAADTGITRVTANAWLSVLEASHLVFLTPPWFTNPSKRLIKTPKLYFVDPGVAGWLIGIRRLEHLLAHPQRGALFENWVMTELFKAQTNRGIKPRIHFLRDKEGHEIDAFVETAPKCFHAVEVKSGETVATDFFKGLDYWRGALKDEAITPWVVYGGSAPQDRERGSVLPWSDLGPILGAISGY